MGPASMKGRNVRKFRSSSASRSGAERLGAVVAPKRSRRSQVCRREGDRLVRDHTRLSPNSCIDESEQNDGPPFPVRPAVRPESSRAPVACSTATFPVHRPACSRRQCDGRNTVGHRKSRARRDPLTACAYLSVNSWLSAATAPPPRENGLPVVMQIVGSRSRCRLIRQALNSSVGPGGHLSALQVRSLARPQRACDYGLPQRPFPPARHGGEQQSS